VLLLRHRAAARVLALAEVQRERHLLLVRDILAVEDEHGVFVHAGLDVGRFLLRQRLAQVDAGDLADKVLVKLPDQDRHWRISPYRAGGWPASSDLTGRLLPTRALSTLHGRAGSECGSGIPRHQPAVDRNHRTGQERCRGQAQAQRHVRDLFRIAVARQRSAALGVDRLVLLGDAIGDACADRARTDAVHGDAFAPQFHRERAGQAGDAALGRRVGA
ncbi:hypothetical protein chiPu_0031449, partial [Chiloscyllium punctatum]|nr:hypothetical protein [Chiloscyllium punctatum]